MRRPRSRRVVLASCVTLIFCLTLWWPLLIAAKPTIEKQTFVSNNKKRTFYLFVPEGLSSGESVPLLLVFHGSGRNGLSLVEKWKDLATKERFIVAGLDSQDSSHWSTSADGPSVVHDLVDLLESKYPINTRCVYLFGHSAGAVYAINLSMIESEYFTATAVHAGSWREQSEFEMLKSARRKLPIAIWVGTKDPFFSVESVRATRDALTADGFVVEVTEMPGHDHWYYDLAPQINEAAWQFLKRYALTENPRYVESVQADKAADANKLIASINGLWRQVMTLVQQANSFENQIAAEDAIRERADLRKLATDEIGTLKPAAGMARDAAQKAELAAQMKIGERNRAYLMASARYYSKFAELIDAQIAMAEVLLSNEPTDVLATKRLDARKKVEELQREVDELVSEAQKAAP
jgi:poly(3-hydroxybutyrate) depolymerase